MSEKQKAQRSRKKRQFLHLLVGITILLTTKLVEAQTECFPTKRFPKILYDVSDLYPTYVYSTVGSESQQSVYVGGRIESATGGIPYIMKVNYSERRTQWRRYYETTGMDTITAMRVSTSNTMFVVGNLYNGGAFSNSNMLMIIKADDGGHIHDALKLTLGVAGSAEHRVIDSGILFTSSGTVLVAFRQISGTLRDTDDGAQKDHAGRQLVGSYDVASNSMNWLVEQDLLGYSAALAYKFDCATCQNIYVGGVNYIQAANNFQLSISRLRDDGTSALDSVFHINQGVVDGDHSDPAALPFIDHLHLTAYAGNDWLFGTTRSIVRAKTGLFAYIWKVMLDATTGNPDALTVNIYKIDGGWSGGSNDGYFTGLRTSFEANGDLHMVYKKHDRGMYYYVHDWSGSVTNTYEISTKVDEDPGEIWSVFVGTDRELLSGVNRYQGYIGVQKSTFPNAAFNEIATGVQGTLDSENCEVPNTDVKDNSFLGTNFVASQGTNMWRANTLLGQASAVQPLFIREPLGSSFYDYSPVCEMNTPTITTIEAGAASVPTCQYWDGQYTSVSFSPNRVTAPQECTDAAPTWIYEIDQTNISAVDEFLKVSIDSVNELVWVKAMVGPTTEVTYTVTITGRLPTGQSASFDLTISLTPCSVTPIIPPVSIPTQIYYVQFPMGDYDAPAFTIDAACPQTILYSNTVTLNNFINDNAGVGKYLTWQTSDDLNIAQYTVTISATNYCVTASQTYTLDVQSVCNGQLLQIDIGDVNFTSPALVQNVWQPFSTLTWDDTDVTLAYPLYDCGPLVFELVTQTDAVPDPAIFLLDSPFDTRLVDVQTDDSANVGIHPLRIMVKFALYLANPGASKDFTVEITDICETPPFSITPSAAPADVEYTVARPALQAAQIGLFTVTPAYCRPFGYILEVLPDPGDLTTFTFDDVSMIHTVETLDITKAGIYTVETRAVTALGVDTGIGVSFQVTIVDPCIAALLTIDPSIVPVPYEYTLFYVANVLSIPVTAVTSSETIAVCPSIVITITKDDLTAIDSAVFTHDPLAETLTTYSNLQVKIGFHPMQIQAKYAGVPYSVAYTLDFTVEVIDPCLNDATITPNPQTNPPDYFYTALSPAADFTLTPFTIDPIFCIETFSCLTTVGPTDICAILGVSTFDTATGAFQLGTTDMATYTPGTYTLQITSMIGSDSNVTSFEVTLVDPCPTATISMNPSPFSDQSSVLFTAEETQTWDLATMYTINTLVDCGAYELEFYMNDGLQTPLNPLIFEDRRALTTDFARLFVTDNAFVGTYEITYRIYLAAYTMTSTEQTTPFTITIQEGCYQPISFVAPATLLNQEYTLTASSVPYTFAEFTVAPASECIITYTHIVSENATGDLVVTFDASTKTFTFEYLPNLAPLVDPLALFKDYTITVTGTAGDVTPQSVSSTFNLRVKNPCYDPLFVSIDSVPLPVGLEYIIFDYSVAAPYSFSHTPFQVTTLPVQHSLCGGLTYEATFETAPINTVSTLVTFDSATNTFSLYSEDYALLGLRDITVGAYLTNYPSIVTAAPEATQIQFIDPCIDYFTFAIPAQTDPPAYLYTASPKLVFDTVPFVTDPPQCAANTTYACTITAGSQTDLCSVATGNTVGTFDPNVGQLTFQSFDMAQYLPGFYTLQVMGTSGAKSLSFDVQLEFVDPCLAVGFNLRSSPLSDRAYILLDPAIEQTWQARDMIYQLSTQVDCGPITVELFNSDDLTPINSILFEDDRSGDPVNIFRTLETEDRTMIGTFQFGYNVYFTNYPLNVQTNPKAFKIEIIDSPCLAGTPTYQNQFPIGDISYILGRPQIVYPFDELFVFDQGVDCGAVTYDFLYADGSQIDRSIFQAPQTDQDTRVFKVLQQRDTKTIGQYKIKYVATFDSFPQADPITLKNPFTVTIERAPSPSFYVFNVEPDWISALEDQYVVQGDSLTYVFGENVNFYGEKTNVTVMMKEASLFARYDQMKHALVVNGTLILDDQIGLHKITVRSTYLDPKGQTQSFSKAFYLHVKPRSDNGSGETNEGAGGDSGRTVMTDWDGLTIFTAQEKSTQRPVPFIADFSQTGVMTIGWDRRMKPYSRPKEIPLERIAASADLFDDTGDQPTAGRRRLVSTEGTAIREEVWFQEQEEQQYRRMLLLDALQVQIEKDAGVIEELSDTVENFTWDVIDFDRDFIWLQINFQNPSNLDSFTSRDYITVTFWGVEFFKSYQGFEVEFGTKLTWRILRQLKSEEADQLGSIISFINSVIVIGLLPMFLIIGLGGQLLPTWIFLNSLQLMSHVPMLDGHIPANLHYFLVNYLSLIRLNSESLGSAVDAWQKERGLENYKLVIDEDSSYSVLLNMCGYKHAFSRNLVIVIFIAMALLLAIAAIYIWRFARVRRFEIREARAMMTLPEDGERRTCRRALARVRSQIQRVHIVKVPQKRSPPMRISTQLLHHHHHHHQRSPKSSQHVSWTLNFGLRFVYEFYLEICICVLINLSAVKANANASDFLWTLSLLLGIASTVLIGFTASLFWRSGPYTQPKSYQKGSLLTSFWGKRELSPENCELLCPEPVTVTTKSDLEDAIKQPTKVEHDMEVPVKIANGPVSIEEAFEEVETQRQLLLLGQEAPVDLENLSKDAKDEEKDLDAASARNTLEEDLHQRSLSNLGSDKKSNQSLEGSKTSQPRRELRDQSGSEGNDSKQSKSFLEESIRRQMRSSNHNSNRKRDEIYEGGESLHNSSIRIQDVPEVVGSADGSQISAHRDNSCRAEDQNPEESDSDDQSKHKDTRRPITSDYMAHSNMVSNPVKLWQQKQIRTEAKTRIMLEEKVKVRPAYQTLFYGLKENHAHNVAIVHPLAFFLRRVFYALIVVKLAEETALSGAFLLLASCLATTCFLVAEQPWVNQLILIQHLVNEVLFYFLCISVVLFSGVITDSRQISILSWLMIATVCVTIIYNVIVIVYDSVSTIRLLYVRYKYRVKVPQRLNSRFKDSKRQEVRPLTSKEAEAELDLKKKEQGQEVEEINFGLVRPGSAISENVAGVRENQIIDETVARQMTVEEMYVQPEVLLGVQDQIQSLSLSNKSRNNERLDSSSHRRKASGSRRSRLSSGKIVVKDKNRSDHVVSSVGQLYMSENMKQMIHPIVQAANQAQNGRAGGTVFASDCRRNDNGSVLGSRKNSFLYEKSKKDMHFSAFEMSRQQSQESYQWDSLEIDDSVMGERKDQTATKLRVSEQNHERIDLGASFEGARVKRENQVQVKFSVEQLLDYENLTPEDDDDGAVSKGDFDENVSKELGNQPDSKTLQKQSFLHSLKQERSQKQQVHLEKIASTERRFREVSMRQDVDIPDLRNDLVVQKNALTVKNAGVEGLDDFGDVNRVKSSTRFSVKNDRIRRQPVLNGSAQAREEDRVGKLTTRPNDLYRGLSIQSELQRRNLFVNGQLGFNQSVNDFDHTRKRVASVNQSRGEHPQTVDIDESSINWVRILQQNIDRRAPSEMRNAGEQKGVTRILRSQAITNTPSKFSRHNTSNESGVRHDQTARTAYNTIGNIQRVTAATQQIDDRQRQFRSISVENEPLRVIRGGGPAKSERSDNSLVMTGRKVVQIDPLVRQINPSILFPQK